MLYSRIARGLKTRIKTTEKRERFIDLRGKKPKMKMLAVAAAAAAVTAAAAETNTNFNFNLAKQNVLDRMISFLSPPPPRALFFPLERAHTRGSKSKSENIFCRGYVHRVSLCARERAFEAKEKEKESGGGKRGKNVHARKRPQQQHPPLQNYLSKINITKRASGVWR